MLVSAEWFCAGRTHPFSAGGGELRVDEYQRVYGQTEVGIKRRGGAGALEVKGLIADAWNSLAIEPFFGPLELWVKWGLDIQLAGASATRIAKRRWLRKFYASANAPAEMQLGFDERPVIGGPPPDAGCNVELTRIELDGGQAWWTLGFEAFGPLAQLRESVTAAAATLAARQPSPLGNGIRSKYPFWLVEHADRRET